MALDEEVELRPVTAENLDAVLGLRVREDQEQLLASNVYSLAQAYCMPPAEPRAIYSGGELVGFLMYLDGGERFFLMRLMIDRDFQSRGLGRAALERLVAELRERPGAQELGVSFKPGEGSPEPFYRALGFEATDQVIEGGERVMRLRLS